MEVGNIGPGALQDHIGFESQSRAGIDGVKRDPICSAGQVNDASSRTVGGIDCPLECGGYDAAFLSERTKAAS